MPSPNNNRRVSNSKVTKKQGKLAPQLSKRKSQDFTSKVKGWDVAGAGVTDEGPRDEQDDQDVTVVIVESDKENEVEQTNDDAPRAGADGEAQGALDDAKLKTPKGKTTTRRMGRAIDLERQAWVRKRSKPQTEIAMDVKHATTPKKRVISDSNWRRDKDIKDTNPIRVTGKEGLTQHASTESMSRVQAFVNSLEASPADKKALKSTRSGESVLSENSRRIPGAFESSRNRSYDQRKSNPANERITQRKRSNETSTDDTYTSRSLGRSVGSETPTVPSSRSDVTASTQNDSRQRSNTIRPPTKNKVENTSKHESSTRVSPIQNRRLSAERPPKIRSPTPRDARVDVVLDVKVHGNRIEGWLSNTSDPFTDSRDPSLTPSPLEITKRVRKQDRSAADIGLSPDQRRSSTRKSSRRSSSEQVSQEDWSLPASSAERRLRRTRATRRSSPRSPLESPSEPMDERDYMMSGALPAPTREPKLPSQHLNHHRSQSDDGASTISSRDRLPSRRHIRPYSSSQTYSDPASTIEGSTISRASDGETLPRRTSHRKADKPQHPVTHSTNHRMRPSRSVREQRRRSQAGTIEQLMNDFSGEEIVYQRELRTLVDGVIPVLLQYALSEKSTTSGGRVFSRTMSGQDVTKPITDMGIALERLRTAHRKIPLHNATDLVAWAENVSNMYSEYLQSWRLGFKDIIINLAPAEQTGTASGQERKDSDLEKADVAYLLKRPLVRLKYLTKTFKEINEVQPSLGAAKMSARYHELVGMAKQRITDESARLEDEAASSIDTTRARDPRSLAPISGVKIDTRRGVRARDYFDMDLMHSSGQQLGCKVELIFRDDTPSRGKSGDILFCEISTTGRWLLYPPMPLSLVSARSGSGPKELVVMIRGYLSNAQQWREIMSLRAEEEHTCADWLRMLGSSPMPPRLARKSSFNMLAARKHALLGDTDRSPPSEIGTIDTADDATRPPQSEVDVPIGEQFETASTLWDGSEVNSATPGTREGRYANRRHERHQSTPSIPSDERLRQKGYGSRNEPEYFYEMPSHKRDNATSRRPVSSYASTQSDWTESVASSQRSDYSDWRRKSDGYSDESDAESDDTHRPEQRDRPGMGTRTASVPSLDLPKISKLRPTERQQQPAPTTPRRSSKEQAREPTSAPAKMYNGRLSVVEERSEVSSQSPPANAPRPSSFGLKTSILPSLTPAFLQKGRRSSSPLKHEYAPSSASDSLSDSDVSDLDDSASETSESTVEEDLISTIGDLKAFQQYTQRPMSQPIPETPFSMPGPSLAPSESASQAPYRSVPPAVAPPEKTYASIFAWSDRGSWDSLHPEECIIFVTPGLIEAFDLNQAASVTQHGEEGSHVSPSSKGIRPLVALELTPLVPLRRGTAIDISIRSPPTAISMIRGGDNIMFRSQNTEECAKLYGLINRARIDNPTYIALQTARGPVKQSNWAEVMDRQNAARSVSGSWWNLGSRKGSTYRSNGSRGASTVATDSSVGTIQTAFSALRRFSSGSRIFNIAKSTISSREGTRSTMSESLSSGIMTPATIDPRMGTPLGMSNVKIRLYARDGETWRELGPAQLTILLPPRPDPNMPASPYTKSEKRVLVHGKSRGELLLDVTLGAPAFGRVGRTGIAINVFEDSVGPDGRAQVADVGGVNPGRNRLYMMQMKSQRDATYTFGLIGRYWQ